MSSSSEYIEKLKAKKDIKGLIAALKDKNLVRNAAEALSELGDPVAVKPLIDAFNNTSVVSDEHEALAVSLGELGDLRAVKPLIGALWDWNYNQINYAAAKALVKIGEPAVQPLISALKSSEDFHYAAPTVLGDIGDPQAVEPLINILRIEDMSLTEPAKEALIKIGAPAVEALNAALRNRNMDVRCTAAEVLGEIGDTRAVEPLIKALMSKNQYVCANAAEALGKLGDERAVEPLKKALKGKNEYVRSYASEALKVIESEGAVLH